ncbi:MAG: SRPBCC family protein [Bacteroidetes bacterium]|nr:MAG: SRPBCC family protein [Bacteroidota bacterium]
MKIKITKTNNAPAEVLWTYLSDYSNIQRFHPLLNHSGFIEGSQSCEIGATRQCDMKDGNYIKERVIEWEEDSHYSVEVYDTSMPIKNGGRATLGVRPLDRDRSETYMIMDVEPEKKFMQPMLYLMFKFQVGPAILKGLEDLYQREHLLQAA